MVQNEKVTNLLSMAQRAGKCASGQFAVKSALDSGKVTLMLIAGDAAESIKKEYSTAATAKNIPYYEVLDREALGHCLGKELRSVAVLLDKGFSKAMEKRITER